jgi:hypothetical protein
MSKLEFSMRKFSMKNYLRFHKSNAILRDNQEQKENALDALTP